jgi:hypothetical protein
MDQIGNNSYSDMLSENNPHHRNNDVVKIPAEEYVSLSNSNSLWILYITFAIIIGILLLWIIIVVITREDPIKILNDMIDLTSQIKPVNDISLTK